MWNSHHISYDKKVSFAPNVEVIEPPPNELVHGGDVDQMMENNGGVVVLKTDLQNGGARKVEKFIRGFPGVVVVKLDVPGGNVFVYGEPDPVELRKKLEEETHKKVELLWPVVKTPKSKEPDPTAVLKVALHCDGCTKRICKIIRKTKGFMEIIKVDREKDLVTVKGAMDINALAENIKKRMKKPVEIVPQKKEEKKQTGDGGGSGSGGGCCRGRGNGGGGGSGGDSSRGNGGGSGSGRGNGGGSGSGRGNGGGGENIMQRVQPHFGQQFEYYGPDGSMAPPPPPHGYIYAPPQPVYVPDPYNYSAPAPQLFSDENPNAYCTIM